jgi:hypothetical protein
MLAMLHGRQSYCIQFSHFNASSYIEHHLLRFQRRNSNCSKLSWNFAAATALVAQNAGKSSRKQGGCLSLYIDEAVEA